VPWSSEGAKRHGVGNHAAKMPPRFLLGAPARWAPSRMTWPGTAVGPDASDENAGRRRRSARDGRSQSTVGWIVGAELIRAGPTPAARVLGRTRPALPRAWQVILDGAQAGWRTPGGTEAGIFGGVVPDAVTLAPSLDHGTFGAYWIGQHSYAGDSSLRFLRHEARIAFINTADLGQRLEGEALLEARVTRQVDLALDVRGGGTLLRRGLERRREPRGAARRRVGPPPDSLSLIGSSGMTDSRFRSSTVPAGCSPAGRAPRGLLRSLEPMDALRLSSCRTQLGSPVAYLSPLGRAGDRVAAPARRQHGAFGGYFREDGWAPGSSACSAADAVSRGLPVLARVSWFRTTGIAPGTWTSWARQRRSKPSWAVRGAAAFTVRARDAERTDDAVRTGHGKGRFADLELAVLSELPGPARYTSGHVGSR